MIGRRAAASALLAGAAGGLVSAVLFAPKVTDASFAAVFLAYTAVGWLIVRHHPHNSVGWLLLAAGATGACLSLLWGYRALAPHLGLPGDHLAVWIESWLWAPIVAIFTGPLLAVFPTGGLLSPRWRWVPWTSGAFAVLAIIGNGLYPWPAGDGGPNPYGIPGAEVPLEVVTNVSGILLMLSLLGGIAALVVRYRRGGTVERRQLKLFLAAAVLVPAAIQIGEINNQALQDIAVPIGMSLLAVATGIAILRHGLYDIDRIISRTVGWALVTVVIATVYLGAVTVLTSLTARVAGQSTVAVAASTLIAAAAFGPVRRRVQSAVDRRFNRSHYDAAHTVQTYRAQLRDDLDIESITVHLHSAIAQTLQPERAALWLRTPEPTS